MKASASWRGGEMAARLRAASWAGVVRAVVYFHNQLQLALNRSNPRPYDKPSLPGEEPRKRTGWLQQNVVYELNAAKGVARIGLTANAEYGLFLELGTARMQARPWLLATLRKHLAQIKILLSATR